VTRYPRRTIALGPPFDDGSIPDSERPADASGATQPSNGLRSVGARGKPRRHYGPAEQSNTQAIIGRLPDGTLARLEPVR